MLFHFEGHQRAISVICCKLADGHKVEMVSLGTHTEQSPEALPRQPFLIPNRLSHFPFLLCNQCDYLAAS